MFTLIFNVIYVSILWHHVIMKKFEICGPSVQIAYESSGYFSSWKKFWFHSAFFIDFGWEMLWLPWLRHAYWYWAEHCGTRPIVRHTRGSFCIFFCAATQIEQTGITGFSVYQWSLEKGYMKASWLVRRPLSSKWKMKNFCFLFFFSLLFFLKISFLVKNISISQKKSSKPCSDVD